MQNTAMVRAALKNLMDATDEKEEEGDADIEDVGDEADKAPTPSTSTHKPNLSHSSLVNWQESFTMTRKKWKVGV